MPMVQVRPRSRRKVASTRDREVQGMLLATLGSDLVAYGESTAALKSEESPYSPTRKAKPKAEVQPLAYRKVLATWPDPWPRT